MKFFWPIYLSSLFVGTAGVYVAAPLARPYVAGSFSKTAASPQPSLPAATSAIPAALPSKQQPPVADIPPSQPSLSGPNEGGDDAPPALHGIYPASRIDKPTWGVTHQRTSYYKPDGSRMGHVPGGTVLTFKETRSSSKGAMVACQFLTGDATNSVFLVSSKDVYLFTGLYTNLTSRQITALQAYYTLNSKIVLRRNELLQASASKNPFFAAFNAASAAYMANIDKAKELAAQRNRVTEADKMRLEDQLREMKMVEKRLKAEYDDAHLKFRTWKDQHASEFAQPENDPDVKKWTQEMSELQPKAPGLTL